MDDHIDSNGSLSDRFFRTLTGNRRVYPGHVGHVTDSCIRTVREVFEMNFDGKTPLGEGYMESPRPWPAGASIEFMVSDQRKFATTTDMKSMGFVPHRSMPGDSIAILIGCSVPVVIRKRDAREEKDGWALIGECYIDGIMEGELMPKYWKNEVDVQTFKLT